MNTEIEQRLQDHATTVDMSRSVDDIFRRGDRLRRHRTRALVGAGAAATVAVLTGSMVLPPGSSPVLTPAVASWSGGSTNLTPRALQAVTDACLDGESAIPAGTVPVAAESRDGRVLAYFRTGATQAGCLGEQQPDGSVEPVQRVEADYTALPAGTHLSRSLGFGYADPGVEGGPVTEPWTVKEVSSRVDHVSAEIGGETFDGTVIDGVALFWVDGDFSPEQVDDAVFTAYDAHGEVLARIDPLAIAREPQPPNDDAGR